jgi:putative acetyltransferase
MIAVSQESPRQAEVARLLAGSDAESAALYPPESRHGVDIEALAAPDCRFFVARESGLAIGCGGVVVRHGEAEVKRLFVAPAARCRGVARRLLDAIEAAARDDGARVLRLETGVDSHAALALYRRVGFAECPRFGAYPADPLSVFLEKTL